ncbi:hypothetical protein FH972_025600 [Carpinus fangiana]|uniref:DUF1746 domain-containing protein n=1 Tax=Carpinus fangiana TaxID=176857 RepID=A0A5N6L1H4_9ROSI|nr:hypothetical protein FH972_025600 [Carpinus fangiana]
MNSHGDDPMPGRAPTRSTSSSSLEIDRALTSSASAFDAPPSPTTAPPSPVLTSSASTPDNPHSIRLRKRASLLKDLLLSLDSLILINLAATYYLDTLSLLFLFRTLAQRAMQLTAFAPLPHIPAALAPMLTAALDRQSTSSSPQLALLTGTTILAITLHLFMAPPSAGEATRGYLHGGLFIDFVGQKAASPVISRLRLVALDVLSGGLQVIMVCVLRECRRCEVAAEADIGAAANVPGEGLLGALIAGRERRMRRADTQRAGDNENGIELNDMGTGGRESDEEEEARRPMLEAVEGRKDAADQHPLDELNSGQVVVTTLHVLDTLRNCFLDWKAERRLGTV